MQQTLLNLESFQPASFYSNQHVYQIFEQKTIFHSKKIPKISTCMALFYSARLLLFETMATCTFIPTCNIIRMNKVPTKTNYGLSNSTLKVADLKTNLCLQGRASTEFKDD